MQHPSAHTHETNLTEQPKRHCSKRGERRGPKQPMWHASKPSPPRGVCGEPEAISYEHAHGPGTDTTYIYSDVDRTRSALHRKEASARHTYTICMCPTPFACQIQAPGGDAHHVGGTMS